MELRRHFIFSKEEQGYLDVTFPKWETLHENNFRWLLLNEFNIPNGYNVKFSTAAISIPVDYPDAQLDMVYFYPHLSIDNKIINAANHNQLIDGKLYQRWSRHYSSSNPWNMGVDSIITHIMAIENWLVRELN